MPINKVIYYGTTLIDISDSTVTPETLLEGVIAYDAAGNRIVGTMRPSSGVGITDDGNGNVVVTGAELTDDGNGNVKMGG